MKAYFWAFINYEQNDLARHLPMVVFVYNNAKNISPGHISFKLNCSFHPRAFYKQAIKP